MSCCGERRRSSKSEPVCHSLTNIRRSIIKLEGEIRGGLMRTDLSSMCKHFIVQRCLFLFTPQFMALAFWMTYSIHECCLLFFCCTPLLCIVSAHLCPTGTIKCPAPASVFGFHSSSSTPVAYALPCGQTIFGQNVNPLLPLSCLELFFVVCASFNDRPSCLSVRVTLPHPDCLPTLTCLDDPSLHCDQETSFI